jgi:hypothetical protein
LCNAYAYATRITNKGCFSIYNSNGSVLLKYKDIEGVDAFAKLLEAKLSDQNYDKDKGNNIIFDFCEYDPELKAKGNEWKNHAQTWNNWINFQKQEVAKQVNVLQQHYHSNKSLERGKASQKAKRRRNQTSC